MDFPLGQSLVMGFWLGQSLVVALLQYYFGRRLGNRFYMGRRFWGSFLFWVDHEGRPYVIRSILVDGWGCHYGIRFNQCGNVNHSFSTICTVSFNIIIPFSIYPNIHTLLWHGYEIQSRLCIIVSFQTNTAAVMFGRVIAYVLFLVVALCLWHKVFYHYIFPLIYTLLVQKAGFRFLLCRGRLLRSIGRGR